MDTLATLATLATLTTLATTRNLAAGKYDPTRPAPSMANSVALHLQQHPQPNPQPNANLTHPNPLLNANAGPTPERHTLALTWCNSILTSPRRRAAAAAADQLVPGFRACHHWVGFRFCANVFFALLNIVAYVKLKHPLKNPYLVSLQHVHVKP